MKNFLKNIILFSLFFSITYISGVFIFGHFIDNEYKTNLKYSRGYYGHLYSRIHNIKDYKNIDILFLGSSHTYRGFDTRIFKKQNIITFNLGSSAQTPIQSLTLVKRYINELNPKLIIMEVFPSTFSIDGVESALDIISNTDPTIGYLDMIFKTKSFKVFNTYLYAYTKSLLPINNNFLEPKIIDKDTYIDGGFVQREIEFNSSTQKEITCLNQYKYNDNQLDALHDIVDFAKENNTKIAFVYAPVSKNKTQEYNNHELPDSIYASFNIPYINFRELKGINDSIHFYDSHHLNQNGVTIFNDTLIQELQKNFPEILTE